MLILALALALALVEPPGSETVEDPGPTAPAAPAEPTEPDPWAPQPPTPQVPPSERAVLAQQDPDLAATLNAPAADKRGYAKYESPQRFAVEVKVGPYLPDVDRNYEGSGYGPYAKVFGQTDARGATIGAPRKVVMPVLHFEWQIVNPLALQGVFRFELLADRLRVPLVPYAKGGLAYAFWWSRNADRKLSRASTGEKALGGVWGWQLNLGAMLRLDFLDVASTNNLDRTTGINHTYLFGEFQLARINNFGKAGSMSLGDTTWFAGLAVEF